MNAIKLPASKPPPPPPKFKGGMKALPALVAEAKAPLAILREAGYPTDCVVLDFETYFDDEHSLKEQSIIEYVMDSRFEVLGLAVLDMPADQPFADYEQRTKFWSEEQTLTILKHLQRKYGENLERATVIIQNAPFDATILARRYGIYPLYVVDTLALAAHWHARKRHNLDTLVKDLGLTPKGDTQEFKGLTFRKRFAKSKSRKKGPKLPVQVPVITDEQIVSLARYAENDAMREWEVFTLLLPRLSRPEVELRIMQHTLELFTKPVLEVDCAKGGEIAKMMGAEIDKAVEPTGLTREEVSGNDSIERALGRAIEDTGENPMTYWKPCKGGMKLAEAKDDPERELLLNHRDEAVRNLMRARVAIKSWPLHVARVERIINQARAAGGKLPVPLKYYGAHTGRWSGREKINLQNLGSRGDELVNSVREMLIAPAGYKLAIVDASQIEARVLAWIAGQADLVAKFANNEEIYCGFASKVLGWPVRKPRKAGGIPAIEARMKWARNSIGKIGVLGCGYGMGQTRIWELGKGEFDMDMALKIRDTYRAENPDIVRFWKDIERAFLYTAKFRKPCEMPRGLCFHSLPDCDVVITLPCGRELFYHRIKIEVDEGYGEKIEIWNDLEHHWDHTWGGSLTENVVQAMSRDILAEAFLRLEVQGYHTAHHVHDEIVMVVPADRADAALVVGIEEMSRRPVWALDCPLGAEGNVTERYGGH